MQLFKDRNLSIAILVSLSWHLLCIFSILPILISGDIRRDGASISFLGSILEKVVALPEKSFNLEGVSFKGKIRKIRDRSEKYALMPPQIAAKAEAPRPDKEKFLFSEDRHKNVVFKMHYEQKKRPRIKFKDVLLEGQAENRAVLYRPDLSRISIFSSSFNSDYKVSIRFRISRHGFIERPECIISSGFPEVDQMAMRYIRRWQFVPYLEGIGVGNEGIVRVSFRD